MWRPQTLSCALTRWSVPFALVLAAATGGDVARAQGYVNGYTFTAPSYRLLPPVVVSPAWTYGPGPVWGSGLAVGRPFAGAPIGLPTYSGGYVNPYSWNTGGYGYSTGYSSGFGTGVGYGYNSGYGYGAGYGGGLGYGYGAPVAAPLPQLATRPVALQPRVITQNRLRTTPFGLDYSQRQIGPYGQRSVLDIDANRRGVRVLNRSRF